MLYKRIIISLLILSLALIFTGCLSKLFPVTPEIAPPAGTEGILYLEPATLSFTSLKTGSTSITFKLTKTRDTYNKEIATTKRNAVVKSK